MPADQLPYLRNPVLERMRAGQPALGLLVKLGRSPDIARIARATGHDFVFIDTQHGIFDVETIVSIANAALALDVAPVVRARGVDDPDVSVLLDNGVTGIVFPDVNTVEQAQTAVARTRFPPLGKRSVGGPVPHFDYQPMPTADLAAVLNESTLVVAMIETAEAVANVDAIATVPGIDVIHVGSNDLLMDMNKPGQFDAPELVTAQEKVIAAAKANGKFAGCGGNRDVGRQGEVIRKGARFLTTQTDIAFLSSAASHWTSSVREQS